jgi:hypothetical protein
MTVLRAILAFREGSAVGGGNIMVRRFGRLDTRLAFLVRSFDPLLAT